MQALFVGVSAANQQAVMKKLGQRLAALAAQGRRAVLFVRDEAQAVRLDEQLWTFDEESFLPHSILGPESSPLDPVIIVQGRFGRFEADLYVNLTPEPFPPELLENGAEHVRLIEFIRQDDPEAKAAGKKKWDRYREAGLAVEKHDL
jgi:DNA polymerase-3 subunit chi